MACPARNMYECVCRLDCDVWESHTLRAAIYPQAGLMAHKGLLFRYRHSTERLFGLHRLNAASSWEVIRTQQDPSLFFTMTSTYPRMTIRIFDAVKCVGLSCVRTLQRWWRFVKWRVRAVAFMMCTHKRLGADSRVSMLENGVLQMCL